MGFRPVKELISQIDAFIAAYCGMAVNAFSGRPVRISHTRTPQDLLHELIIHLTRFGVPGASACTASRMCVWDVHGRLDLKPSAAPPHGRRAVGCFGSLEPRSLRPPKTVLSPVF
jgi:hypothetical protein